MKEYVLVYAEVVNWQKQYARVFVIQRKNRPEWQKGRLNFPGGHIEAGEDPVTAAVRELKEETGLEPAPGFKPSLLGKIEAAHDRVYCVHVFVNDQPIVPREGETEVSFFTTYEEVKDDKDLIPNLRVIIPIMQKGLTDWLIWDDEPSWDKLTHTFSITVKSDRR